MEIDEKSLFTTQEAALLRDLMKTAISHRDRIIEEKLKHVKQNLKDDPGFAFIELLCKIGDVDADKQIDDFLARKRKEFEKRSQEIAEVSSSILRKLPDLVK